MTKNYDKTSSQRSQRRRDKWLALGFERLPERFCHPDDKQQILNYIDKKNKKRFVEKS